MMFISTLVIARVEMSCNIMRIVNFLLYFISFSMKNAPESPAWHRLIRKTDYMMIQEQGGKVANTTWTPATYVESRDSQDLTCS